MHVKSIKIYFFFAVLMLVAKPFLGFTFFSRHHPPAPQNIFVKAFTKRTLEYSEDSSFNILSIHNKLANPDIGNILLFSFFLTILFPLAWVSHNCLSKRFLRNINFANGSPSPIYLLNGNLII